MRVVSSPEAITAIDSMLATISGGLTEEMTALAGHGDILLDPMAWDGPLAANYRDNWPTTKTQLNGVIEQLLALQSDLSKIQANIQTAGGAAA